MFPFVPVVFLMTAPPMRRWLWQIQPDLAMFQLFGKYQPLTGVSHAQPGSAQWVLNVAGIEALARDLDFLDVLQMCNLAPSAVKEKLMKAADSNYERMKLKESGCVCVLQLWLLIVAPATMLALVVVVLALVVVVMAVVCCGCCRLRRCGLFLVVGDGGSLHAAESRRHWTVSAAWHWTNRSSTSTSSTRSLESPSATPTRSLTCVHPHRVGALSRAHNNTPHTPHAPAHPERWWAHPDLREGVVLDRAGKSGGRKLHTGTEAGRGGVGHWSRHTAAVAVGPAVVVAWITRITVTGHDECIWRMMN